MSMVGVMALRNLMRLYVISLRSLMGFLCRVCDNVFDRDDADWSTGYARCPECKSEDIEQYVPSEEEQ